MNGFSTEKLTFNRSDDWDETQRHYEEFIYYDRYGIFDFMVDKSNLTTFVSKVFLSRTEIGLHFFVRNSYYFENDFSEEDERIPLLKALEHIHVHMKRGNIIMRVNVDINKKIIKNFDINNADEMIDFMMEEYQRQSDKEDFLEYGVGIKLSDDAWANRIYT